MGMINYGRSQMTKIVNPKIFSAFKHGVSSKQGLLPYEKAKDYAALEAQWDRELRPHGMILKNLVTGIVRNLWLQLRNAQATAIFAACHPFGRTVAEAAGEGDWVEAARKQFDDLNARHITLVQTAELLRKQAVTNENVTDRKRRNKAADKLADAAQRIATQYEQAMKYFLGVGGENKKQADRDVEFDGKLNKHLTKFFDFEQMLATRDKLLPQKNRQSSADDYNDFDDELPEKSEPKAARPIPEKKVFPDPKKDSFDDDDDWGASQKH